MSKPVKDLEPRAAELDAADTLSHMRDRFHIPEGMVYLDGNSLGLMPVAAAERVANVARGEWAEGLIRSWSDAGWFHLPMTAGDRIAPLVGAGAGEIAVGDSTSVNLFKCMAAALQLRPGRRIILSEGKNFPTDNYMAQGLANLVSEAELRYFEPDEDPADQVDGDVAVVLLSHVDYRSARIRDMAATTAAIQARGALVVWDLSHTSGGVPCDLTGANADFAVGCTYKYLNGGPGAPAFAWANPRHAKTLSQPLSGWMGHAAPFDFSRDYAPAEGARRFVCGTPQILSLSSLDEALKLWADVDLDALWAKSREMTGFFIDAVETLAAGHGLSLISPRDPAVRGSHVSFDIDEGGFELMQVLAARKIIGDFRAPRTIRFGFAPLYLRFADTLAAAQAIADILTTREWDDDAYRVRGAVT
ncbi:MAG: kynureninase [Pseudomonadota bacterium]|nr:kynureninase [Pseudomonadota bacterium]